MRPQERRFQSPARRLKPPLPRVVSFGSNRSNGTEGGRCSDGIGRRAAFTLIEVIVALALFAIAATVLASAYVNVLNAMESVKGDQALEQEVALVRSVILLEPEREKVEEGGDVPTAGLGDATWRATVTPSEEIADLFRVDLEIILSGGEGDAAKPEERTVTQVLWVLRPDWSEPTERDALRAKTRDRLGELKRGRSL